MQVNCIRSDQSMKVVKNTDEDYANQEMNQASHWSINDGEPEYLESFSDMPPLASGRNVSPRKSQTLRSNSLQYQLISSDNSIKIQSLGYNRRQSLGRLNSFTEKTDDHERCPNCNRILHRVRPGTLEKGQEKVYSDWTLPYWGQKKRSKSFSAVSQPVYLPHYCKFVRSKLLHERTGGAGNVTDEDDQGSKIIATTAANGTELRRHSHKPPAISEVLHTAAIAPSNCGDVSESNCNLTTPCSSVNEFDCSTNGFEQQTSTELSQSGLIFSTVNNTNSISKDELENNRSDNNSGISSEALDLEHCKNSGDITKKILVKKNKREIGFKKVKLPRVEKERTDEITKELEIQEQVGHVSPQPDMPVAVTKTENYEADICVPELPKLDIFVKNDFKNVRRAKKKQIDIPHQAQKSLKTQLLDDEAVFNFYDYGDLWSSSSATSGCNKSSQVKSSHRNIRALPLETSRFELPVDMTSLESLSPQDYLRNYSRLSSYSKTLCLKMFHKYREKTGFIQGKQTLLKALNEVFARTITEEQEGELCTLLDIEDPTSIDFKLFSGITAVAERLFFPEFWNVQGTAEEKNIERADFYSLSWKLRKVQVNKHMRILLDCLS